MAFLLEERKNNKVGNIAASGGVRERTKSVSVIPTTPAMILSKGFLRVCCTKMVEPRLVDVRSKGGDDVIFETVWVCPTCHRATC